MLGSSSNTYFVILWILRKTLVVDPDVVENIVVGGVVAGLDPEEGRGTVVITMPDTGKNRRFFSAT